MQASQPTTQLKADQPLKTAPPKTAPPKTPQTQPSPPKKLPATMSPALTQALIQAQQAQEREEARDDAIDVTLSVAQIGLDIRQGLLTSLVETPAPFLDTVLSLVNIIIETARQAKANQVKLKRISDRIEVIKPFLERLKFTKCTAPIIFVVIDFGGCIKMCIAQADRYNQTKLVKRFVLAGTDKAKFQELIK
jgi:hypothetical protein